NQPDCLTDRDAAAAAPGVVVGTDQVTEDGTRVLAEDAPRRIEVCRGVTEAGRAEIEHRPQTALANQKVRRREIAVDPAAGAVPGRPVQRVFPYRGHRRAIDEVSCARDPAPGCLILLGEGRPSAVRRLVIDGRQLRVPQLGYEAGQAGSHLALIVDPSGLVGLALDPPEDGPCERILCGRPADTYVLRYLERESRS